MGTSPFDQLPKFSFAGFDFPVESYEEKGGLRDHVHEYPHSPGGAPEKLGRKLYEISVKAVFVTGLRRYNTLWPDTLYALRRVFEQGKSADLVVPTNGTIPAYCVSWDIDTTAKIRNGQKASLVFREDQQAAFLNDSIINVQLGSLAEKFQTFSVEADAVKPKPDLFSQIQNAFNSVQAYIDTGVALGYVLGAKLDALAGLLRTADSDLNILNNPVFQALLDALHELWSATLKLGQDLGRTGNTLLSYTVPTAMSVQQIATALYQDASRASDIVSLNVIDNPFLVPAGKVIRFYKK